MKRDPTSPWPLVFVCLAMALMFAVALATTCNGGPPARPPYPQTIVPHSRTPEP